MIRFILFNCQLADKLTSGPVAGCANIDRVIDLFKIYSFAFELFTHT